VLESSNQPGVSRRRRLTRRPSRTQQPASAQVNQNLNHRPIRHAPDNNAADPNSRQVRQSSLVAQPKIRRTSPDANGANSANVRFNLRHLLFGGASGAASLPTKREALPRLPDIKSSQSAARMGRSPSGMVRSEPARKAAPLSRYQRRPDARAIAPRERSNDVIPLAPTPIRRSRSAKPQLPSSSRRQRQTHRSSRRSNSFLLYTVRLLILGVGIGAIAGTFLSVWDPAARHASGASPTDSNSIVAGQSASFSRDSTPNGSVSALTLLPPGREMTALATQIKTLATATTELTAGVYLIDLDNGDYLDINGTTVFSAASMIKVPVLVAFLQDVDAGKIRLDESLTMEAADVAEGSGDMQYQEVGTQYSALETATKMIVISDNTATNMLIRRMGGIEVLNQRFQQWGLTQTSFRNLLPDLEGTNLTTPKELADLLVMVTQGDLLSLRSRDRLLDIMRQTVTDTLLPSGLSEEAVIAHKTGDIGSMVGDTGIVDAPNGKRYVITAMVKRPHNDDRAQALIREVSRLTYQHIIQPTTAAPLTPAIAPSISPANEAIEEITEP
jgi:beta-lactamase class A